MVVLSSGSRLTVDDLPANLGDVPTASSEVPKSFDLPQTGVQLQELERHLILQALERCRGSLEPASKLLGISYKTLQYRIRKYGLEREGFTD